MLPQVRPLADNSQACVQELHAQGDLDADRAVAFAPKELLGRCCYFL